MSYPKVLNQFPDRYGESFQPSNGTEGMIFIGEFCDTCYHDRCKECMIAGMTMVFNPGDTEYPKEWVYSNEGWPICTKYQHWDGNEDSEPKPQVPDDPDQLCMNFYLEDVIETLQVAEPLN